MKIRDHTWQFTDGTVMPIGTMYCVGRNYAQHAAEMNASVPSTPVIFIKPPAAFVPSGSTIVLPTWSANIHHEVELVVVIGADNQIAGYGVGLDLTARDVQLHAKQHGEPWATAKGWHGSAPVSAIVPLREAGDGPFIISLAINGQERQCCSTALMERSVAQLIQHISDVFTLRNGDCIFTGTPHGVGAVTSGDHAFAQLDNIVSLSVDFA